MNPLAHREEELFREALLKSPEAERSAFLDEACQAEPELRSRLELLLEGHFMAQGFLDSVCERPKRPTFNAVGCVIAEKPGDRIGRFKLLEQIGEGGCGVVYMAEQQEPVRRRVALKIIKLGMDTKSVIARFEAERQALALMDHPNIAKVLDAGATETGRPYFVMELVRGIKITDFCDQNNLSTRQRLHLLMKVCDAVHHAHQKGIIHRDLKPSNVLVTLRDGIPVPKVIDFGIAKATTDQRLTDKTLFTAFEQFIGTPAYMSPEQAERSELGTDTRSDIYSLGVLLYELLTGQTPFDVRELLQAGLDGMRRTIREKEPDRPSTRVSTLIAGEATTVALHRQVDVPKLISVLRGDLDWIVMKCLEKDRARRYDSANDLARDLQRHLTHEPVVACPPSKLYRIRKMVRRNKVAVSTTAAIVLTLLLGLGISTWSLIKERQGRRRAVEAEKEATFEAAKATQMYEFLKEALNGVGPSVARGRDTTVLREIVDKAADRVSMFTNQPQVEFSLRSTLAEIYDELGLFERATAMAKANLELIRSVEGLETLAAAQASAQLGHALWREAKHNEAEAALHRAIDLHRKLGNKDNRMHSVNLAIWLTYLGGVLQSESKFTEAEAAGREAVTMCRHLSVTGEIPWLANALDNLGVTLLIEGKLEQAETTFREALATREALGGRKDAGFAVDLDNLASVLVQQNKVAEAETMRREALATLKLFYGGDHPDVAISLNNLSQMLENEGKLEEAEANQLEALSIQKAWFGESNFRTMEARAALARVLIHEGKLTEALAVIHEACSILKPLVGDAAREEPVLGDELQGFADLLRQSGQLVEARCLAEDAFAMYQRHPDWPTGNHDRCAQVLAGVLAEQGDLKAVETFYSTLLADKRARWGPNHYSIGGMLAESAVTLLSHHRYKEAERWARKCLAFRDTNYPDSWLAFSARCLVGESLLGQTKYADAEPLLLAGYQGMEQRKTKIDFGPTYRTQPHLKEAGEFLLQLYQKTGRSDKVSEWKQKLAEIENANPERNAKSH